ncbi:hypothetical protein [Mycobacterium sp. C31M]
MLSARWAAAVVVCLSVAGCGAVPIKLPGTNRDVIDAQLAELRAGGQPAALITLTEFDWDEVHLFADRTPRHQVEAVVGGHVIEGSQVTSGGLLVFEQDGRIVRKVYVRGDYLRADRPTWGVDAVLRPAAGGLMRLTAQN